MSDLTREETEKFVLQVLKAAEGIGRTKREIEKGLVEMAELKTAADLWSCWQADFTTVSIRVPEGVLAWHISEVGEEAIS